MRKYLFRLTGFHIKVVLWSLIVWATITACSDTEVQWPESTAEARPWTRWWWPGNAVDSGNISRELQEMANAGIGGVEITSIYGIRGEEDRDLKYLSSEFNEALNFTIKEANKLGMGVDLPPGSGWRLGGPFVPEEKGLWSLRMHSYAVAGGEEWQLSDSIKNAELVSFVDNEGSVTVLSSDHSFSAPLPGKIYVAQRVKNGDKVKRASEGGKGWAIDTFNEDVTEWYLEEFMNRLEVDGSRIRSFFHDSFEYTGDFTPEFSKEFKERRGYDLIDHLHVLAGDGNNNEITERVRTDYRQTLAELVLESFIQPMTAWANGHNSMNRNQAHGSPGNILDLYAACDIPETEIFGRIEPGSVNLFVNKFASSAAHVTGKKLVSSESFTWLDEHWTVTPADMMRATNRLFLSGVNHMFFHGTCYSPADAQWPGWLFYASSQINNRNPLWPELPALFKYIERSQAILQQATPQNDLLVYWPYYDVAAKQGGGLFFRTNIDHGDKSSWFSDYPLAKLSQNLSDAGYTFDYISDRQLLNSKIEDGQILTEGNSRYKALVLPAVKYIPVETMQQVRDFIAEGGTVYFDESLPESVPGMADLESRQEKLDDIKAHFLRDKSTGNVIDLLPGAGIQPEASLIEKGFRFTRMNLEDEIWYMVVNCTTEPLDGQVVLNVPAKSYVFYFPDNGEIARAASDGLSVRLQLAPERAVFIRCAQKSTHAPAFSYYDADAPKHELEGIWKINFMNGGPVYPGDISTDELISWTRMGDENTRRFAGTASYVLEFDWNEPVKAGMLNLGEVRDCARVKLNGKDYGVLLGPAFMVKVDNLRQGKNRLEVEVTNVATNRIRDLDLRGVNWKKFHDINFVNIDYEPFDASGWPVREAGLTGKVEVTLMERK